LTRVGGGGKELLRSAEGGTDQLGVIITLDQEESVWKRKDCIHTRRPRESGGVPWGSGCHTGKFTVLVRKGGVDRKKGNWPLT